MTSRVQHLLLFGILVCGLIMSVWMEWSAYGTNGRFGFPLDDPWIHLQFAKNLHDYGTFSYYKNEMVTSGSTSPLYTFLLAAGFSFTRHEMVLSYLIGVLFLPFAGFVFFKLSMKMFEGKLLFAAAAVVLLLFEPRLQWVALSGMETTLFIFLLLAVLYYYKTRKSIALGIGCGLLIWTRPEALLFLLVLAVDAVYHGFLVRRVLSEEKPGASTSNSLGWLKSSLFIIIAFGIAYAGFNVYLSGSFFPNTYAAKIRYYSKDVTDFPLQVFHFITDGHLSVVAFFVAAGILTLLYNLFQRKSAEGLIPFLWSLGLFLAYWKNLPYLYQEGRYLMPILPFVIMLGLHGLQTILEIAEKVTVHPQKQHSTVFVSMIVLLIFAAQFVMASWGKRTDYAENCKYINDRQVRTAVWLHDHLPENAVVATHDIGAIAFYSGRRIADMMGLVSPEMVENIGKPDKLKQFLIQKKTTHLAVLRNWFEIVNQNSIYRTDEEHPEIMEVFEFDSTYTYSTPQSAGNMTDAAGDYLSLGNLQSAESLLGQSLRIDPRSSKTHFLLGSVYAAAGRLDTAEAELKRAMQLHPFYWDAQLALAQLAVKRNQPQAAVAQMETIVQQNPSYIAGYRMLAQVYKSFHLDSAKADYYLQRYNQLVHVSVQ